MNDVVVASEQDRGAWDAYVGRKRIPFHAHSWGWKAVLGQAFGHRAHYLVARSGERVTGILPLFEVRSMLFGRALISLPYLNGGGVVADDADAAEALLARASALLAELRGAYLELRHREPAGWGAGLHTLEERSHKVSMILELERDPEALMKRFPAKLRSQIRRPSKDGVTSRMAVADGSDPVAFRQCMDAFYEVFSRNMRDLGTPVYPRRLFDGAAAEFGGALRVITGWFGGRPVAAAITVRHGQRVEVPWASSLREYNRLSPNMLVYWEAIRAACEEGSVSFDFGRSSPDSGTYRFKEQWGSQPLPLYWYYVKGSGEIPDVNPKSSKFALLVSAWRRLPLPVANIVGPWVTRSLP